MAELDHLAADLTRQQHALISLDQARDVGFTRSMIRTRCRNGHWRSVNPHVFAMAGAPLGWHAEVMAACLATGGWASHRSAAALYGVLDIDADVVEITIPRPRRGRVEGAIVHRSGDVHRVGNDVIDDIPVTTPARLTVDLGAVIPYRQYVRSVEDLIVRKLVCWDEMADTWAMHSRQGRNGCGPLRDLLEAHFGEQIPESPLERWLLRLIKERGLPEPVQQLELFDDTGFIARVDFAYPELRIIIEADGLRYHADSETFERDHRKRARLSAAGWTVLAFTWAMVRDDPDAVIRTIRRALERAGR